MPTFDGESLIITLDSGVTEVNVQENLYEEWKAWMLSGNMRYPAAFRTIGGDPLSAIINAGSYYFLQNDLGWRIKPPEEDITAYLTGNLAVEDTSLPAFIATTGTFTAAILGLQPVTQGVTKAMGDQLEQISFNGGVAIDVLNGNSGTGKTSTGGIIGTRQSPSNNSTDAHTILDNNGLNNFFIMRDMTIAAEDYNLHAHKFIGDSSASVTVTINDSTAIDLCEFSEMIIQGKLDNGNVLKYCNIKDIIYFNGIIRDSIFEGTLTLDGNVDATITDCSGNLVIDMGISGQSLNVYRHSGSVTLTNKSGATDDVTLSIAGGLVTIDPTVTAGTIIVRGNGTLKHTQTGTEVVINYLVDGADISSIHWLLEMQRSHHTGVGNIWYWDPYSGDDTAEGDHISRATKTFARAHDLVVDNNHDVIMCIPGDTTGKTITTENITISKDYLFLRGPGRDFEINSANDLLNAISITGKGVEVSGISVTTSTVNTQWAIHSTNDFTLLKDLWVANAVNGVHFENGGYVIADNVKMHHNLGIGLKLSGTCEHADIIDCHIGSNTLDNVVIDLDASTHEVNIMGDTVIHNSVTGYGINISGTTESVIVYDSVSIMNNFSGGINDLGTSTYNVREANNDIIVNSTWLHSKALTLGKYLGLK